MVQFCGHPSTPLSQVTPLFFVNVPAVATPYTQFFVQLVADFVVTIQVIADSDLQDLNMSSNEFADNVVVRIIGDSVNAVQFWNIL